MLTQNSLYLVLHFVGIIFSANKGKHNSHKLYNTIIVIPTFPVYSTCNSYFLSGVPIRVCLS